jgi:UDPglucose 6-dehydrogenase
MDKVGIVGLGFVGGAVASSFDGMDVDVAKVDIDPAKGGNTYDDLMECDAIFVCVPSPMAADGTCDSSILEGVLETIHDKGYKGVIISKSTATPARYKELAKLYPNLVHAPEFLTAANAIRDYANGSFAIIGGSVQAYIREAERFIKKSQPGVGERVVHCSIEEAALAKYGINTFLSTKVVFMNELYQLAKSAGADYDKVAGMMKLDKRIGSSHMRVPGVDGLGFDGMCFPKDTSALLHYAKDQGVELAVLDSAVRKNKVLRNIKSVD